MRSIREAMTLYRGRFSLSRTKQAMTYSPERQTDGALSAKPVFTNRIRRTAGFGIYGPGRLRTILASVQWLTCISDHPTVEARDTTAMTSLRLLAVLDVRFKYTCARQAASAFFPRPAYA